MKNKTRIIQSHTTKHNIAFVIALNGKKLKCKMYIFIYLCGIIIISIQYIIIFTHKYVQLGDKGRGVINGVRLQVNQLTSQSVNQSIGQSVQLVS